MKIIIFGTGNFYEKFKYRFRYDEIVALMDNDEKKIGTIKDGYEIIEPKCINSYCFDKIVILIYQYETIKKQLINLGVDEDKIITIDNMESYHKYRKIKYLNKVSKEENRASILLVSHEMNLRGAPLMLLNLGTILIQQGYNVSIASSSNGNLSNLFIQNGIEVIIVDEFDFNKDEMIAFFSKYDFIIVNTLAMWKQIKLLSNTSYKIMWWLHEEKGAYDILKVPKEICNIGENIYIYGVGNRAIEAWREFSEGKLLIHNLMWGIEEIPISLNDNKRDICIFAVVGSVCYIKGQDVLIRVLEKNRDKWNGKIQVWFLGKISPKDKSNFENIPFVKCFGELSHDEVMKLYDEIDGVISTSRNDTMPVNLIEAMMKKLVCLCSNATGVADYIEPYKNGLVFQTENEIDLCDKIQWLIAHKELFPKMGEEGYATYKKYFCKEQFVNNLMSILKKYLS